MLLTYRSPLIAALMLGVVAVAYLIATGLALRPGRGGRDDGQRPVDGDPDRADVRRGHRLLPADRLALPRRAAAHRRRRRGDRARAARTGPAILASGGIVVAAMLVLGARRLQRDARDGPDPRARHRRDGGRRADAAAGAAGGVRAARVLARGPAGRARRRPGEHAAGGASARSSAAARRCWPAVCARDPRRSARSATSSGRGYLDLTEQYRDPPESVPGQQLIARALPAGPRRAGRRRRRRRRRARRSRTRSRREPIVADANTDSQSTDGSWISLEVLLKIDPFSRRRDGLRSRRCARWRARRPARRVACWSAASPPSSTTTCRRCARDAKLIVPLVLVLILLVLIVLLRGDRRAAVRDRDRGAVVRVRARRVVADLHAHLRPARLGPEPDDLRVHLPRRARGRRQHLPDDPASARSTRAGCRRATR